jgi:hypothetical protein
MIRAPSVHSQDDPLSLALRPPLSETEGERVIRLKEEAEAKEASDKIDEEIKVEKQKLQKSKGDVKVCLTRGHSADRSRYLSVAFVASAAWAGRIRQIDFAKTISIDVQPQVSGGKLIFFNISAHHWIDITYAV